MKALYESEELFKAGQIATGGKSLDIWKTTKHNKRINNCNGQYHSQTPSTGKRKISSLQRKITRRMFARNATIVQYTKSKPDRDLDDESMEELELTSLIHTDCDEETFDQSTTNLTLDEKNLGRMRKRDERCESSQTNCKHTQKEKQAFFRTFPPSRPKFEIEATVHEVIHHFQRAAMAVMCNY